ENVMAAIDFIEEHLLDENLSASEAAKHAGFSEYHFHRIFTSLTGDSIAEYIRDRRLSEAALELGQSRESILTYAIKYGFESQETFTRAFKRTFGVTPGAYRKARQGRSLPPDMMAKRAFSLALLEHICKGGINMEPVIVERQEEYVVGMGDSFAPKASIKIKALWDEFMKRSHEIEARSDLAYGVCTAKHPEIETKEGCCMVYIAALPVQEDSEVPPGMVKVKLEGGEYARFTHRGPILEIGRTVDYIWGQWNPQAPYKRRNSADFELYDERFNPESAESEVDIYVPLTRR
ncbi:MAG TPA: AraC family transcriptional regulator, partial [Candidatus Obscuribacter sp.]|nr:AraC family transcriptional regulator [Candidatus Obscuribacter sp.]